MARKRKVGVRRSANGKSRGEPEVIDAQVLFMRIRDLRNDGIRPEHAKNALAGHSLGRLYLRHQQDKSDPTSISEVQYRAGEEWAKIVHSHAAIMGYSLGRPSPSFLMVGTGLSCAAEPSEERVNQIRRQFTDCYNAIMEACRMEDGKLAIREVTYAVCVEGRHLAALSQRDIENLRIGLNALVHTLGLDKTHKSVIGVVAK